jgi:rubrerythrin
MALETSPAELIEAAIRTECEASLFYRMMADMTSDESLHHALLGLAADERSHATMLTRLLEEMTGRGQTSNVPATAEGDPDLFDFHAKTREEVLRFALDNELSAISLYESQVNDADDPRVATMFRLLADTEREHAAYLRLQLERIAEQTT